MEINYNIFLKLAGLLRYVPAIDNFIRRKILKRFWSKIVFPLAGEIQKSVAISDYISLKQSLNQYPVKGLLNSIFKNNDRKFTNLDFAVALYISAHGHLNPDLIQKDIIIEVSAMLTKQIIHALKNNKFYRAELRWIEKDLKLFDYKIHRDTVKETLSSYKKLFTHHFKSFEEASFPDFIRVWHPGKGRSWIDWNTNESIKIYLDSTKIPEGFFLIGFDYYSNKNKKFLWIATRKDGFEYFNESVKKGEIIWLK